jgi:hypothetical protein
LASVIGRIGSSRLSSPPHRDQLPRIDLNSIAATSIAASASADSTVPIHLALEAAR